MIDTRVVKDESGTVDLCETFTNDESKVLKQVETGVVYGSSVIDVIAGYIDGKPYSKYNYEEVIEEREDKNDIPTQEWEEHEIVEE